MEKLVAAMEKSDFEFLDLLDNQGHFIRVSAGTTPFHQGDDGDRMYVILEARPARRANVVGRFMLHLRYCV